MRLIPTKVHGMLDYLSGALLVASPWLFDFANGGAAQWIPVIAGGALVVLSLCTDYELGLFKRIAMSTHLTIDILTGIVLAASPWLFGFADEVYLPHVILGVLEIGAGLLTQRTPSYAQYPHAGR